MGAALTGCDWSEDVGLWRRRIGKARFDIVDRGLLEANGWSFGDSPSKRQAKNGRPGFEFGNCSETYPFSYLLCEIGDNFRFVHGLAIRNTAIKPSTYDDRLSGAVWDACRDPCPNCRELLSLRHGDPTQFAKEKDLRGPLPECALFGGEEHFKAT